MPWRWISIPEELIGTRFIQASGTLTAGEIMFACVILLIDAQWRSQYAARIRQWHGSHLLACGEPAHAQRGIIGSKGTTIQISESDTQRIKREMSGRNRCGNAEFSPLFYNSHMTGIPGLGHHGLRVVADGTAMWEQTNTKQIGGQRRHLDCCRASL